MRCFQDIMSNHLSILMEFLRDAYKAGSNRKIIERRIKSIKSVIYWERKDFE